MRQARAQAQAAPENIVSGGHSEVLDRIVTERYARGLYAGGVEDAAKGVTEDPADLQERRLRA